MDAAEPYLFMCNGQVSSCFGMVGLDIKGMCQVFDCSIKLVQTNESHSPGNVCIRALRLDV